MLRVLMKYIQVRKHHLAWVGPNESYLGNHSYSCLVLSQMTTHTTACCLGHLVTALNRHIIETALLLCSPNRTFSEFSIKKITKITFLPPNHEPIYVSSKMHGVLQGH